MKLTHPDKLYWPEAKVTKAALAAYYTRNSRVVLPYLTDRPLSLKRYPEGIDGMSFFQKNFVDEGAPAFLTTKTIRAKTVRKNVHYLLCNNTQTLRYLANNGALELHPWNSRTSALDKPDFMVFDLDPGEKTQFVDVINAARAVKKVLDEKKLTSFIKTSGKRGLHIYVPIGARYSYDKVRAYARALAQNVVEQNPALTSLAVHPKDRRDKIYIDYLRNSTGQTVIAPYCTRATPNATISTPLEWSEVKKGLNPNKFTIKTIEKRLKKKGDPWRSIFKQPNALSFSK
ncbi:MAG TPA: non-homologous end-joining DNA ligase [Candidatus Paceibacterota bacterium]|nr:non-homologous end-joining DNA ligase [Candidatus Paceibacterota bacterium]